MRKNNDVEIWKGIVKREQNFSRPNQWKMLAIDGPLRQAWENEV